MATASNGEARAAARMVGLTDSAAGIADHHPQTRGVVTEADWGHLGERIVAASQVEIIGVLPAKLVEAIRTALDPAAAVLPPIEYHTPLPELALNLRSALNRYATRWHIGYMGLRNLIYGNAAATGGTTGELYPHFGYGLPALSFNCLIHLTLTGGRRAAVLLTELLGDGGDPPYLAQELTAGDPALESYLDVVHQKRTPISLREVRCKRPPEKDAEEIAGNLRVGELVPIGAPVRGENTVRPIAILVIRYHSPAGLEILLKRRSRLTDTDDFDKLSLLSARVQEADLAASLKVPMTRTDRTDPEALDDLWLAAGSPHPMLLHEEAFRLAGQREVGFLLGFQIGLDRFVRRGFHYIDHEGPAPQQLAFMVFTVDLTRSAQVDELRLAMTRNLSNLERIRADDIYDDEAQLNRFLRRRREWLVKTCFID